MGRARRYVFTPARRAALKRAQAKSAAKRRKRGAAKKVYKTKKRSAKNEYRSKKNAAAKRYNSTVKASYTKNKLHKYDALVESGNSFVNQNGNAFSQAIGSSINRYAESKYASELQRHGATTAKAAARYTAGKKVAKSAYKQKKRAAKKTYRTAKKR